MKFRVLKKYNKKLKPIIVKKKELDAFHKEIHNLEDWQQNQYNPGYYIGTGRVPKPYMGLSRYPILLVFLGLLYFVVLGLLIWKTPMVLTIHSLLTGIIPLAFIIGGIQRLRKK